MFESSNTPSRVLAAVEKITALRKVSRETGTVTRRAQSLILRSLNEQELTAAALLLAEREGSNE